MCNEIFTTENMNEIVTPIYEAMKAGNPVAKLVFDLNDAINALKPGRPISKAERDRIEFIWDNLLVGHANELVNNGEGIASVIGDAVDDEEIKVEDKYFDSVLYKWHKAYNDMITKEADKSCKESDKEKSKLAILSALETVVPEMSMSDLSDLIGLPEQLIIDTVSRKEGAEEDFIKQIKPVKAMALIAVASNVIDIKLKNKDEDKYSGGCKCKCNDKDDNDGADIEEMVNALKETLERFTDDDITIKVARNGKTPSCISGSFRGYMPDTNLERIIKRFFGN